MKEALYYNTVDDAIKCELCPRYCTINVGKVGSCGVRENINGTLQSLYYGQPCAVHIDPIEKKPLYHVLPGSTSLSIATIGCNLFCNFCQNWQISKEGKSTGRSGYELTPDEVVSMCLSKGCRSISYTYTEPTIFYEYMLDIAKLAKQKGIKNTIVSNGYINEQPLRELCNFIDAANIDLKAFNDDFYREMCRAELAPVLKSLKVMKQEGVWVEITNLVVPGQNDDLKEVDEMCTWIATELGRETALHFSRFHPDYKYTGSRATPLETLYDMEKIARKYLDFVYLGNVGHEVDTHCPGCGEVLIRRQFFAVAEMNLKDGACPQCATRIAGVWT